MLIFLSVSGIYIGIQIRGIQFTRFKYIMKNTIGSMKKSGASGGVSGFQAVSAALAATLGTGNIVGIGIAIAYGGPGAIFWMWIVGLIAMGIKFSEVVASLKFREIREDGEYSAGPYNYIAKGVKNRTLAKFLSIGYVISLIVVLLIAAGVHTGAITDSMEHIHVSRFISTAIAIIFVVFIVYGGVSRIVNFTEKLVPIMATIYIIACTLMIIIHIDNFIPSIISIFKYAFTGHSAIGGFAGSAASMTIRWGVARGMYSNDSGNGIQSIVHGQADVKYPVEQGIWGVFEVFFSTIVVCTFSALAILSSGAWKNYTIEESGVLAQHAFSDSLGTFGTILITVAIVLFAFSTVLSFAFFIENQTTSLFGKKAGKIVQLVFFLFMGIGGVFGVTKLMQIADFGNAFIILINMTAILILGKTIGKETKEFFDKIDRGEI
ncbi:sodium:alanine symporter family protein [Peptoniphilus sp. AGMB00490]|uniref:Sodium:alanine symporter family protein n=1 Tax=Peptoniphilus faecalis TaxID=2731255 RepID=A0A848RFC7_9FIRM|nr:amino acid carrier protein [Peptoniphilus faecalis]NMW84401.1 sodium:alanine symporter family protein [Peptoniphilus faecalis]